eukprot:TRINITY_DN25665_c0_g1_i1.p1 TRINITY_DN25665_c0_g1~~TRINITY_DN25665_c0_g1_i1.p1  ORF type:complete len:279 (+),score=59.95 TRINITY_DN25665_c0_g1_i1:92-838(+)
MPAGGLLLYVRRLGDQQVCLEVAPDATVGDVLQALKAQCGWVEHQLFYAGQELQPADLLSDVGIGTEATIDVGMGEVRVDRWLTHSPQIQLSEDGRMATLLGDPDGEGDFCNALGPPIQPGQRARWRVRIGNDQGGIRSLGVTACNAVDHNNHGHYSPEQSIAYQACHDCIYGTLLGWKDGEERRDKPHIRRDSVVLFELGGGKLVISLEKPEPQVVEILEGLESFELYPFICFYRSNHGNTMELVPF